METPSYIESVFAPYLGETDDRTIIDGCFGKNGHYPPRPEDEEWSGWNELILKRINEAAEKIQKATEKK